MTNNIKLKKALWKYYLPKIKIYTLIFFSLLAFSLVLLVPQLTTGTPENVIAKIEQLGISNNSNGDSVYLMCRLPDGNLVRVFPGQNNFKKGDKVVLLAFDRFIGGKKYQFLRKKE